MALTATLISSTGIVGVTGTRVRYGSGAPTSSTVANDGDSYVDTVGNLVYGARVNGVWPSNPVSNVGLRGPTGATPLVSTNVSVGNSVTPGPAGSFGVAVPLSSSYTNLPSPGTTRPAAFYSGSATCGLQSALFVNQSTSQSSVIFQLVRTDNGAVIFNSGAIAAGSTTVVGPFTQGAYGFSAGLTCVWQVSAVTTGKTCSCAVYPSYFSPGEAAPAPAFYPRAGLTSGTVTASSGQTLFLPGDDTQTHYYRNNRASALYGAVLNNQTATALTFSFGSYTSGSVAANTAVVVGPLSPIPSANRLAAATNYQWSITGFSGSISNALVSVDMLVVV